MPIPYRKNGLPAWWGLVLFILGLAAGPATADITNENIPYRIVPSNVRVEQDEEDPRYYRITYNLHWERRHVLSDDPYIYEFREEPLGYEGRATCYVTPYVSFDAGNSYPYALVHVQGNVGLGVEAGEDLEIVWDAYADFPDRNIDNATIMIQAEWNPSAIYFANVSHRYSKPYITDVFFNLRDHKGRSVYLDPSSLGSVHDDRLPYPKDPFFDRSFLITPIDSHEAASYYLGHTYAENRDDVEIWVVMDYTNSMKATANIEAMEAGVKYCIDHVILQEDDMVGLYEFHREDQEPQKVSDLSDNADYLKLKVDKINEEYVQGYHAATRCWDALAGALSEFTGEAEDGNRYIIVFSDGLDNSSSAGLSEVIATAQEKGVAIHCIDYYDTATPGVINPNLIQLAQSTGGMTLDTQLATDAEYIYFFQRILNDIYRQYRIRLYTLQRTGSVTPTVSFTMDDLVWGKAMEDERNEPYADRTELWGDYPTANALSASYTLDEAMQVEQYAGDVSQGILRLERLVPASVDGPTPFRLHLDFAPRNIYRLNFFMKIDQPWSLRMIPGGVLEGWEVEKTPTPGGGYWITLTSTVGSMPFAGTGEILDIFVGNLGEEENILNGEGESFVFNNTLYHQTGGQSFTLLQNPQSRYWQKELFGLTSCRALNSADMNGDNLPDVVGLSGDGRRVGWWENGDSGRLARYHAVHHLGHPAAFPALGDMNGDGRPDIVMLNQAGSSLTLCLNEEGGFRMLEFSSPNPWPVGEPLEDWTGVQNTIISDLNGDGTQDVIYVAHNYDELIWWRNNGGDDFERLRIKAILGDPVAIYPADVDGNGQRDFVMAGRDGDLFWYHFESMERHILSEEATGIRCVYATDVDDDSDVDILTAGEEGLSLWRNNGFQVFSEEPVDWTFLGARSLQVVDYDYDGDWDLAAASPDRQSVYLYTNDGEGNFTGSTILQSSPNVTALLLEDFNGDLQPDPLTGFTEGSPAVQIFYSGVTTTW